MGKEPGGTQKNAKGPREVGGERAGRWERRRQGEREGGEESGRETRVGEKGSERVRAPWWKPDGIAFVVCYGSSGFFGWE